MVSNPSAVSRIDAPAAPETMGKTLDKALAYIHQNIGDPLPLPELARIARLSHWRFCKVFRSCVGVPPHRYINQRRLQRAQVLLREGVPAAEAACSCGFYDQSHFSRCFKRSFGVTPGQFQTASRCVPRIPPNPTCITPRSTP